jgi:hypothetical protein
VLNGAAQVFAASISTFLSGLKLRTIINGGFLLMCIFMIVIAVFAIEKMNTALVVFMMVFLATYQLTLGTFTWVYLGQVASDEGMSIGVGSLWFFVLILAITTNSLFNGLGNAGTFFLFASFCLASTVFFFFFLRETKGLTRDECQKLYSS